MSVPLPCSYQSVFVWICVCIWIASVCVLANTCMMQRWEVSTSPCNPQPASSCVPYGFFSPLYRLIPSLVPLKWQFVKHGPLLVLSFASQPFPARLLPSPPPVVPPHTLLSTSLLLHPSLSFISIPPVHPRWSLYHFILFVHPSKCDCFFYFLSTVSAALWVTPQHSFCASWLVFINMP